MMTEDQTEKLWALIKDVREGMLVTKVPFLRARPMGIVQKDFDGTLWFFTSRSSEKVSELEQDNEVCVTFANPGEMDYVSMTGSVSVSKDRQKIEELWNVPTAAFFPEGKDDPDLVLLKIDVERAEYWDSKSSKMVQLYEFIKGAVTHRVPDLGENRKLS
jgi:general stress protein 26